MDGWIHADVIGLTMDMGLLETLARSKMEVSCNLD